MRDRICRLEAVECAKASAKPYCWVWAWQTDAEALEEYNRGRDVPLSADQVTWIRTRNASGAPKLEIA
jgi:hypothetical protein